MDEKKVYCIHICPRDMAQSLTSKEDLRRLAKTTGITHLTIEFDQSLQEHEAHQTEV